MPGPEEILALLGPDVCARQRIRLDVEARKLTSFAVGGRAALVLEPLDFAALCALSAAFQANDLAWRILGSGSNVVFPDAGFAEPLVLLSGEWSKAFFLTESATQDCVAALGAGLTPLGSPSLSLPASSASPVGLLALGGASLMALSRESAKLGLSGLEFAAGIPGSLGGGVKMNCGAHGSSISVVLKKAWVLARGGELRLLDGAQLCFAYRSSAVKPGEIVVAAELLLERREAQEVQAERARCLDRRQKTQPLKYPSAGSVFRNPQDLPPRGGEQWFSEGSGAPPAWWLIDRVGLRGETRGGVSFSELHPNWLIKTAPQACAADVHFLMDEAARRVRESFGVELIPEIILW